MLERMAREGVPEMQFLIGFLMESGLGFKKNATEAHNWYLRSAKSGCSAAQYMLFFANGPGMAQEKLTDKTPHEFAAEWCRKSATAKFAPAELSLSYESSNPEEALQLVEAAAEHGYARAAFTLGMLYENGHAGRPPNIQVAFEWYKNAAELGDADSASHVAWMLRDGRGVVKDEAAAMQWFLKAFEMKSPEAAAALSQIYRFGMLGQPKDLRKAKKCESKIGDFRKWWARSLGLPDKKHESLVSKVFQKK